jgi:molybdopterin-guanine dinucleotide biosynthesis protein A
MLEHRTNNKVGKISDSRMTFAAVLLAGGESRRMGRDKATIVFRGQPLWQRQLELLRNLHPRKIFVSARTRPSWLPDEAELLLDDPPSCGPLSGLTKAIEQVQTSHLIALAVDMPFMTPEQMRVHCSLATEGRGVMPVIGERTEPLAAIYPQEAAADFAATLAGRDFSLQRLTRRLVAVGKLQLFPVPPEGERLYRNVNTPTDL